MSNRISSMENLLSIFEEHVDEDDILSAQILSQISSRIVKFRLDNDMNQKEFAIFLGVSQTMVSKIESSDYNFTIKKLVELCNKMNMYLNVNIKGDKSRVYQNQYIIINMANEDFNYEKLPSKKKSNNNDFSTTKKSVYNSNKWKIC